MNSDESNNNTLQNEAPNKENINLTPKINHQASFTTTNSVKPIVRVSIPPHDTSVYINSSFINQKRLLIALAALAVIDLIEIFGL